jgi:hypothetical protein
MDSQEDLALPVAVSASAETYGSDGAELHAVLSAGDRQLRTAALALALSGSRLRTEEMRTRYASVMRKVTATGQDTAAVTSRMAGLWPHHAERLRVVGAAAGKAAREWHRPADGEGHGSVTVVDPGSAGSTRTAAESTEALRLQSEALTRRLEEAMAGLRATFARIQQGRPQQEVMRHSAFARMRARLGTLPAIEQAKGIIMAQQRCGPDEAFDLLRRASQHMNVPLRELAAQIVAKTMGGPVKPRNAGQAASASSPPRVAPVRQGQASSPPGRPGPRRQKPR